MAKGKLLNSKSSNTAEQRHDADTVTRELKKELGEKVEVTLESKSSKRVDYVLTYLANGSKLNAFFDLERQLYGFEMYNKGIKTVDNIDSYKNLLFVYLHLYTELIPISQRIVELYARDNDLNTEYKTFQGTVEEGFTTQFNIAGVKQYLFVAEKETNHLYRLSKAECVEKTEKYKILDMYNYILKEDGHLERQDTILSVANKLYEKCIESEDYTIKRLDTNTFLFTYDELSVVFSINIGETIEYMVQKINDKDFDFSFILEDYLDLDAFVAAVLDRLKGSTSVKSDDKVNLEDPDMIPLDEMGFEDDPDEKPIDFEEPTFDSKPETSEEETEDSVSDVDLFESDNETDVDAELAALEDSIAETDDDLTESEELSEEDNEEVDTEVNSETENTTIEVETDSSEEENEEENTEENTEESLEETKSEETPMENVTTDELVVSKLMKDENLVGLMFNVGGNLYIANAESLAPYKLQYKRFEIVETISEKHGYSVWESERKYKTFAEDISDNAEKVKALVEAMF